VRGFGHALFVLGRYVMSNKKKNSNTFLLIIILIITTLIFVGCNTKKETEVIKFTEIETTIEATEVIQQEKTEPQTKEDVLVWISKTGKRYHSTPDCSDMKLPLQITLEEAEIRDYTPCLKCCW